MKPTPISIAILLVSLLVVSSMSAQAPVVTDQNAASPAPAASAAEVPRLIKFSGTLRDAQEQPLAGPLGVTFALYAQQSGGTALWMETQNVKPDASGNYTVLLGANSTNGVPAELFVSGEARWLGIQVGQQPEHERVLLVSVPYALKARDADTVGGMPASAFLLAQPTGSVAGSTGVTPSNGTATTSAGTAKGSNAGVVAAAGPIATNFVPVFTNSTGSLGSSTMYQSGSNIGVGTTTPAVAVDVVGINAGLRLSGTGTHQVTVTGATSGRLGQDANGFFFASDTNGKSVRFLTNNGALNEWMRITGTGYVGIGTTTPAANLDVVSAATTAGNVFRVAGPTGGFVVQSNGTSPNIVAGFSGNTVGSGNTGATVSGGGEQGFINSATGNWATISGGYNNTANSIVSTVSGGYANTASNAVATVSGGQQNTASGQFATVTGGLANFASGDYATVSGGQQNTASGNSSFAAGSTAQALHNNTFVWSDGAVVNFASTNANQFLIRAGGGVGIGTASPAAALDVVSAATFPNVFRVAGPTGGLVVQNNSTSPSIVAGFSGNTVPSGIWGATVSGGGESGGINSATGTWATVSGGVANTASGGNATVSGGFFNIASGGNATVSGGQRNAAQGSGSFAAGQGAQAVQDGTFVWADNTIANNVPVNFTSTAANQFLIRASSGVGIGTNAPATALHVSSVGDTEVSVESTAAGGRRWTIQSSANFGLAGVFQIVDRTAGASRLAVDGTGKVGIGTTAPGETLDVVGNVRTTSCYLVNGTVVSGTCLSDARLKTNIQPFLPVLDKLARLQPVHFDWRVAEYPERHFDPTRSSGLVAQEVEKVLPELVSVDAQGFKQVNYSELPYLMLQAIKEQQRQIEAQAKQLQAQQEQLQAVLLQVKQMRNQLETASAKTGNATSNSSNESNVLTAAVEQ